MQLETGGKKINRPIDNILRDGCMVVLGGAGGAQCQAFRVESFNGRFRDECLNEHWFVSLAHARAVIEAWRQEYNDERPKRSLGGLTPAQYAKQLATRPITMPENSKSTCY